MGDFEEKLRKVQLVRLSLLCDCFSATAMKIHISSATHQLLTQANNYNMSERGEIEIKV